MFLPLTVTTKTLSDSTESNEVIHRFVNVRLSKYTSKFEHAPTPQAIWTVPVEYVVSV